MPKAELPHHFRGWLVALAASFVGFVAGFVVISVLNRMIG